MAKKIVLNVAVFEGNDYAISAYEFGGRLSESVILGQPLSINEARVVCRWLTSGGLADIERMLKDEHITSGGAV